MTESQGWVKLHRSMLEWEWYQDINTKCLFLHLLIKANHKERRFKGMIVKRGELVTGREILSFETSLTVQQVRTSLNKLKSTNEITIKTTNKGTVLSIVNYDFYQNTDDDQPAEQPTSNQQVTSNQPTSNQQVTTNKNEKNIKNEKKERIKESIKFVSAENEFSSTKKNQKSINDRKEDFKKSIDPYREKYESEMLNDFWRYWTEKNENGKKMRFEMQKVFDVGRRLITWSKNEKNKFNGTGKQTTVSQSRQERVDEVREFRLANQQALAERLSKYITGDPK